jgi:pyrimidine deaminase RibD-like protein
VITEKDFAFMQLAIEEAAKSERGSETDPKVGAVVVKDGRLVGSAHRGQMAKGDHAEFTLLQKILRSKDRTDGATLYTTLEPCTARSHDKLPCVEWIVQKGIRRVVIGILDPNPTICGRAYWRLIHDTGIEVDLFPIELAREIIELNESFITKQRGEFRLEPAFEREILKRKSLTIAPYPSLGFGEALSLQQHPNIREGWPLAKVEIRIAEAEPFPLPRQYELHYERYFERCYEERGFQDDGEKFMLIQNPVAFTDAPSLVLKVRPTRYSCVQFYRDTVAPSPTEKGELIEDLVRGSLQTGFPHSFCMHMMIVTSDNRLLLTKRSPKVAYAPQTWSASAEEQLSREDLEGGSENAALNWASRLLKEELGLPPDSFHPDNLRLLSVFLEADILNISVCAYAGLHTKASELETKLRGSSRPDYEFSRLDFLDLDRKSLLRELFAPARHYHPTSGLRILYTLLKRHGSPRDDELKEVIG